MLHVDPFDSTDNAGRSISNSTIDYVAAEFNAAAKALQVLRSAAGTALDLARVIDAGSNTFQPNNPPS